MLKKNDFLLSHQNRKKIFTPKKLSRSFKGEPMEKIHDLIIIGGGPAGYTAALYAARAGIETTLIEKMTVGGQMTETGEIENYPGFADGVDGITLGMNMQAGAERFGASTIYDEVTDVSLGGKIKTVTTAFSGTLSAHSIIIAAGASARRLGLDGEDKLIGQGVHYCAHCDGRFYQGREVVVVGGGNTAVGDALYLSNLCERVYLVHRRDTYRASKALTDALATKKNIIRITDSRVTELLTNEGGFSGVKIEDLRAHTITDISASALFVSIGRVPATAVFSGKVETDESGYIIADESTKTSVVGVFAAGDIRTKELRQIITAAADGAVAAHFAGEYLSSLSREK